MQVHFNVRQFLDRAAVTYPERVAVVDEPDQPAEPWAAADLRRAGRTGPGPRPPASTAWASGPASGWPWCPTTRPGC